MSTARTPGPADEPVPTRKQTAHPDPAAPAGGAATRPQGGIPEPVDPTGSSIFPERLKATYQPLELVGTGAEGAVWRVRAGPAELAVKVHWDNQPMDAELLDHLDNPAFHRHVPAIAASGRLASTSGTRDWVAMEYLPRNLDDILTQHRTPGAAPGASAEAVIAELAQLITFWQDRVQRNPLDFKPANILIRDTGTWPGQSVIADFGGIHRFTASQAHGGASRFNLAYAPPEHTWSENASPWPWWGLGEIAYELAAGHARYRRPDGALKADSEIVRGQILGDPGAAIADEHWRLLVRGLLTVDPADRWGAEQVTAWLAGQTPPVAEPAAAGALAAPTLSFGRLELSDPADIAAHLLDRGGDANRWLTADNGADKLTRYLAALGDHGFDTTDLTQIGADPDRAALAVTAFGAHFAPQLTPTHNGRAIDTDGLTDIAATDPDRMHALLADPAALRAAALYHCGHPECRTLPRCDRIQRLAAEAPDLARQAKHTLTETGRRLHPDDDAAAWPETTGAEDVHAHALAALAVLTPAALRTQVEQTRASALLGPHWWRRQVIGTDTSDTPAGRASMVATLLLADRAAAERDRAAAERQSGGAYARSVWHRTLAGILAGLALINATWAGAGSFPDTGTVLASAFPLIAAGAAALALWPWRSPESPSRALTTAAWATALAFALIYRGAGIHPPDSAAPWWPAPEWLIAFMGLLPEPFRVFWWWFQLLISATVVLLAVKFVRLRMRLAYRQRYVHFWDAPRAGAEPEERAGLAPLAALTWLGLLTTSAAAAAVYHADAGEAARLALAAPPVAYLLLFLAAGAALWWLTPRNRLLAWAGLAAAAVLTAGWFGPLRLFDATALTPAEPVALVLLGLAMCAGSAYYLRTRLSPPYIPRF